MVSIVTVVNAVLTGLLWTFNKLGGETNYLSGQLLIEK